MAQPYAREQAGRAKVGITSQEAGGEEHQSLWAKALAMAPGCAEYQEWTERQIPVIVLEPINETDSRQP